MRIRDWIWAAFYKFVLLVIDFNDGHFFSNDAMVMFFLQGTIANDGFSMVLLPPDHHHWMFFCRLTIDIDGFSMVLPKFRYDG